MLNEGNRRDEYLEKKGESTKTTAMRKSSERRGRFSAGDTHQSTERENITWARPGTRPYADSLDRQRKSAHRSGRGRKKPQAGTSSEQRKTDAIWQSRFPEDRPKGKYEKLQDKKKKGETTNIDAQKQSLLKKGERRRELRSQAVNAIRRAMGGGYVSEARDELSSKRTKNNIINFERGAKTFEEFMIEANRKAQRASKAGRKPKHGERSRSTEKPSAVVTVGLPGSGKSTIAKHMVSKGNTDQHELDKSRQALGKGPAYFGSDIVQHTYSGAKKSAEQGRNTVLSNTSIPKQHRQDAINKLKDSGYNKVTPVLSPGSTKAAMRRNRKRTGSKPGEGAVPQFVMNRMAQGMQQMSRDERKELRKNYKKLHKKERFTKPAMKRSGAIR